MDANGQEKQHLTVAKFVRRLLLIATKIIGYLLLYAAVYILFGFLYGFAKEVGFYPMVVLPAVFFTMAVWTYVQYGNEIFPALAVAVLWYVLFGVGGVYLTAYTDCMTGDQLCTGAVWFFRMAYRFAPLLFLLALAGYSIYAKVRQKKQLGAMWYAAAIFMFVLHALGLWLLLEDMLFHITYHEARGIRLEGQYDLESEIAD